jgi:glycosyltransferase involved in cell wall biosynthesis
MVGVRLNEVTPLTPLLSILLPVYNVADYLDECVQSIISQIDADDIEVILLDDASTDTSHALCQTLCQKHGAVMTLLRHSHNQGLSAARNSLLAAARGKYLWFIDSDDAFLPGAIADLRKLLTTHAPDIVMCDYIQDRRPYASFHGKEYSLECDGEALVRGVFTSRKMQIWTKISLRSLWADGLQFPVGKCFEDIALTPWLYLRAKSYYYWPKPWIFYRTRTDSIMGKLSQTRGVFDDHKNDDLASALAGYRDAFVQKFPNPSPETLYFMAHFCAKEFTKIAYRLITSRIGRDDWKLLSGKLNRYRKMTQDCSPLSFDDLNREYLRRRKIGRWMITKLCLRLARQAG